MYHSLHRTRILLPFLHRDFLSELHRRLFNAPNTPSQLSASTKNIKNSIWSRCVHGCTVLVARNTTPYPLLYRLDLAKVNRRQKKSARETVQYGLWVRESTEKRAFGNVWVYLAIHRDCPTTPVAPDESIGFVFFAEIKTHS
jgi:hypothetical protein